MGYQEPVHWTGNQGRGATPFQIFYSKCASTRLFGTASVYIHYYYYYYCSGYWLTSEILKPRSNQLQTIQQPLIMQYRTNALKATLKNEPTLEKCMKIIIMDVPGLRGASPEISRKPHLQLWE